MPKPLTFYTNPMSRGRIVRWMLEEVGAPYETVVLGYDSAMKEEPYLSINPMGKVPTIVHGEAIVTECAAICAYLADAFPEAGLAPALDDRADYYRWLFFAAGPVEQAVVEKALGFTPSAEQARMIGYGSYDKMVETLEGALRDRDFVAGEAFSAADVYIGSQVGWGLQFGTLPRLETFEAYFGRLAARPAYARGNALDDALTPPGDA